MNLPKPQVVLCYDARQPHANAVRHLFAEYAAWWNIHFTEEPGANQCWELRGQDSSETRTLSFACDEETLCPTQCQMVSVVLGASTYQLPLPIASGGLDQISNLDMPAFLAGQLWRIEELQGQTPLNESMGFCDRPYVDLWMRWIFEYVLGRELVLPQPRFWLTHDVDALRKWKPRSLVRHLLSWPSHALQQRMGVWFRQLFEAIATLVKDDILLDPWCRIDDLLEVDANAFGSPVSATFFWLGVPRDHKAYRYDIRELPYANLLRKTLTRGHTLGLHGSPLHTTSKQGLQQETTVLSDIAGTLPVICRQHYLAIEPGKTISILNSLGYILDSSYGFNDKPGFRCGSCIPIRWFDFTTNQSLQIREMPLHAGEWQLHDPAQPKIDTALAQIESIAQWIKPCGGIATLLFHEIYLYQKDFPNGRELLQRTLACMRENGLTPWSPQQ